MAGQALNQPKSSRPDEDNKDPLEAAQQFTRQMAANALIDDQLAKSKLGVAKAEAEVLEAKARAEKARTGAGPEGPETAVKVKGSVDLGTFNYQDLLKQQSDDLRQLKKEAEESAGQTQQENNELRERLHAKEMEVLTTGFNAQMQVVTKMIESNASRGSFMDQYNGVMEMAKTIGFSQPQLAGDVSSAMALEKMKFDQNIELKKMAREEKRADREFQRQLNMDVEEREAKKVEQIQQAKRDDMFAKAPQVIGGAIASGLLANKGNGEGVSEEAPARAEASKGKHGPHTPKGKPGPHLEAGWGETGEAECPGCNQPIAVGPTATAAVCANCGDSVPITRIGEKPGA